MNAFKIMAWGLCMVLSSCIQAQNKKTSEMKTEHPYYQPGRTEKLSVSDAEWKKALSPELYRIARQQGTEYAFSGEYWNFYQQGVYHCAACGQALFESDGKFESSCGWPSFFKAVNDKAIRYIPDHSHGMDRTEVRCGLCDAHLGHIFDDGPPPTGKRYCINSVVIQFGKK